MTALNTLGIGEAPSKVDPTKVPRRRFVGSSTKVDALASKNAENGAAEHQVENSDGRVVASQGAISLH
jgi:hypothetical protein